MIVQKIAELIGGQVRGNGETEITDIRAIEDAGEGHITFLEKKKYLEQLNGSKADAVIVAEPVETDKTQVIAPYPKLAFARLLAVFHPETRPKPHIDPRAALGENVSLGKNVALSAFVSIGDNVVIGDNTVLYSGVVVADGCRIGNHSTLYPNVTLYRDTVIGNHVILHAGAVIGADGFGYTPDEKGRHAKISQIGRVVIEDHVEIGANSCIDRGTLGTTCVKEGVKIDNLVQIAHNCVLGEHSIIVAQVGLSGSCTLGRHVTLAGQVGLSDHVSIGDQAVVAAKGGVYRDIKSREAHGGAPNVPLITWKKYVATLPQLPEIAQKIKKFEKRLEAIENKQSKE
ncbi:MAG: UDP-3-O-(3-hydroxymyristoyl)glucosamine N-acyltransferase [Nitrospinales bacterium]